MTLNVQSNQAALVALQNLNKTSGALEETQQRISSGLEVSRSSDDPARFAVAEELRRDRSGFEAVSDSLTRAMSIADTAEGALNSIKSLLDEMRADAVAAVEPSLDAQSRQSYADSFASLLDQIQSIVAQAEIADVNLLDGSESPGVEVLADVEASRTILLNTQNMTVPGPNIVVDPAIASLASVTDAQAALAAVEASLENVIRAQSALGNDSNQLDAHRNFVSLLQDNLDINIGALVDADLGVEAARLEALQVQQQLSVQSLSIANSSPDVILSLFQS